MTNEQSMVRDFHIKFGCAVDARTPCTELRLLRARLIIEEAAEFVVAASCDSRVGMIDALCDLLYVVYGTGVAFGIDLEPYFAEVHRSNMTKEGHHDKGGKITKGKNWSPPQLDVLVTTEEHDEQLFVTIRDGQRITVRAELLSLIPNKDAFIADAVRAAKAAAASSGGDTELRYQRLRAACETGNMGTIQHELTD